MLIQLKDRLDVYHQHRADKHGWLYWVVRVDEVTNSLYEARSIATGMVCTLDADYTEKALHAVQEPEGPQLQA